MEGEWKWLEANRRKILGLAAAKGQREARPRGSGDKNEATPVTTTERIKGEKDGRRSSRRERKIYIEREAVRRKGERGRDIYADEEKAARRRRERAKGGGGRRREGDGAKEDGVKRTHREPRSHDLMNELAWLLATWWGGLHSFLLLGPFAEATSSTTTISRPSSLRASLSAENRETWPPVDAVVGVGITADLRGRG